MLKLFRAALALSLAGLLAACFESDQTLIDKSESETPIAPGTYSYSYLFDHYTATIATIDNVTQKITTDSSGTPNVGNFVMRGIGDGYYVVTQYGDSGNTYGLVQVEGSSFVEYEESVYCDELQKLAKSENHELSFYGVVSVRSENPTYCKFSRFKDMAFAFETLIRAGVLKAGTVYEKQDN